MTNPEMDEAAAVAMAFLHALDAGRWMEAARLVDPDVAERLLAWMRDLAADATDDALPPGSDTLFPADPVLAIVAGPMRSGDPILFLAALADAMYPGDPRVRGPQFGPERRRATLRRTLLAARTVEPGTAAVRYRTEWMIDGVPARRPGGEHEMRLSQRAGTWRVAAPDLSGHGPIVLPSPDR